MKGRIDFAVNGKLDYGGHHRVESYLDTKVTSQGKLVA